MGFPDYKHHAPPLGYSISYPGRDGLWAIPSKRPTGKLVGKPGSNLQKLLLKGKSTYLIPNKYGEPFKSFDAAAKRAKLQDSHFHDPRRTFATLGTIDARIDEKAMQNPSDHASIETTMRHYVVSAEEHEKEAIKRSGRLTDSYRGTSTKRPSRGRPEYLTKMVELNRIELSTS
jgi:hypothetical protein